MSFFYKVFSIAVVLVALAGTGIQGSAGRAAELSRVDGSSLTPIIAINTSAASSVPDVPTKTLPPLAAEPAITQGAGELAGDVIAYPTLAAAVSAQRVSDEVDDQLRCLAGAIYYESKGEPLAGQLAVAQVILNRAGSGRFARDLCGVVTQPGQFSFIRGGRVPAIDPARPAYRTAMAIAKVAMAEAWENVAGKALYFHARRVAPRWSRTRVAAIGNHVFYR